MLKRDIDRAKAFFRALGFKEAMSVVIAGEPFERVSRARRSNADKFTQSAYT
jgi:catechol 2,3-dioxygenase-like lactoylglutathione lyase family enzyme